jgi:hypothetical protein
LYVKTGIEGIKNWKNWALNPSIFEPFYFEAPVFKPFTKKCQNIDNGSLKKERIIQ